MANPWIYVADSLPGHGDNVFVRLAGNEYNPQYCSFSAIAKIFYSHTSSAEFPVVVVLKWRYP